MKQKNTTDNTLNPLKIEEIVKKASLKLFIKKSMSKKFSVIIK